MPAKIRFPEGMDSTCQSKEDSSTAILAECAGLSELNLSQSAIIDKMVNRLITKRSEYLPTTHLTEHHLELTDYTPIRHHHRRRSLAMWKIRAKRYKKCIGPESSRDLPVIGAMHPLSNANRTEATGSVSTSRISNYGVRRTPTPCQTWTRS